ncbi:hypothetical protein ORI89_06945 [Sphingobacterium sp. UT-1RO-CII-1]|uniref:hypothetical protein n=1 Tax=Sphingobacterium sp. UT-1RO-CII-1 TaxID=2995225 RepID=UPI00227BAE46|nr:hypothetical protein [Sphingobacterium sp. UT-1RO-CII-1]MCY4779380.1 hypothetical protein [Sphingobacterium sp. UT-1RO-CII-1]
MTQKEYALYLGKLIDEEVDTESEYLDLDDQFYAYFQCFMPYGEKAEKIFEPIPNGATFYERLKPIFEVTAQEVLGVVEQGASPGYFVPSKTADKEQLQSLGRDLLKHLLLFAEFIQDEELWHALQGIKTIEIAESDAVDFDSSMHEMWYEAFSNWRLENSDTDSLVAILDEAYYSISCDYYLSAYFQYPRYKNRPAIDFLKPYFELWKYGYRFVISDTNKMILYA